MDTFCGTGGLTDLLRDSVVRFVEDWDKFIRNIRIACTPGRSPISARTH